jgi:predicted RNase H-like HicB family nuclease
MMGTKQLHAVVYKDAHSDQWVASCVEYAITTQGDSEAHALEMIAEAVELHFEDAAPEVIDQVDNEVGSEPVIRTFVISAPALLDH